MKFYKTVTQRKLTEHLEHSDSESYSDTDREPKSDTNEIGNIEVVRCPAKQKKDSKKNLLLPKLRWNNNTTFISTLHKYDASSAGVRPGIFTEDLAEVDYFETMLLDHAMDTLTTETELCISSDFQI
jgi:hypothetical protein